MQLNSGRLVPSQPWLDVGKLKDERVAKEFANKLSRDLGGLGALGYPEELWSAFKTTVLDVAGGCLGTHRRGKKNFVSQGRLDAYVASDSDFKGLTRFVCENPQTCLNVFKILVFDGKFDQF